MINFSRRVLLGASIFVPLVSPASSAGVSQERLQKFAKCGVEVGVLAPTADGAFIEPRPGAQVTADASGKTKTVSLSLTDGETGKVDLCTVTSGEAVKNDPASCRAARRMWRCFYTP